MLKLCEKPGAEATRSMHRISRQNRANSWQMVLIPWKWDRQPTRTHPEPLNRLHQRQSLPRKRRRINLAKLFRFHHKRYEQCPKTS